MAFIPAVLPTGDSTDYRPKLPKPIREAKRAYDSTSHVINIGKLVASAIEASGKTLPTSVIRFVGCMQVYSGIAGIFAVPQFCLNIISALYAKNLARRITSFARAILDAGSIMGAINSVVSGLKAVKVIAQNAISWTDLISKILYPLQFISLALNTYELTTTRKARAELFANTEILSKGETKSKRIEKLTHGLLYIQNNHKAIRKGLSIAKRAEIDKKANECLVKIESQNKEAILKAEELICTLRLHATRKLSLQSASLAIRISGVMGTTLTLVTPPNPFTFGAVATAAILGLALNGLQAIMTPKNPFDPPKIAKLLNRVFPGLCHVAN